MIRFSSKKIQCTSCSEGKKECLHYFFDKQEINITADILKNTLSITNKEQHN